MIARLCVSVSLVVGLTASTPLATDEDDDSSDRSPLRPDLIGVWVGVSFDSRPGELGGLAAGHDFHAVGLRLGWDLVKRQSLLFQYTADIIPFAMVTDNPRYRTATASFNGVRPRWLTGHETKYGVGITPIGFRVGAFVSRVFVFGSAGIGILVFEGEVPTPGASSLNATFGLGGGMDIRIVGGWSLGMAYALHHISNAGRSYENPGIDSHVLYIGSQWRH